MRRFGLILIFCLSVNFGHAQDWGRIWCFGDSAGIDFSNLSMPVADSSWMDCSRSCASVGDSANGLLMYAHTDYYPVWFQGSNWTTAIHNASHNVMINGDSLIGYSSDAL